MDRTAIAVVVICVALLFVMPKLVNKAFPPKPLPPGVTNVVEPSRTGAGTNTITSPAPTAATTSNNALTIPNAAPAFLVETNVAEQLLVITNENARYTFTSHGGGLKLVELLKYPESTPARFGRRSVEADRNVTLNTLAPVPTLALLDGAALQGDGLFTLSPTATGVGVRAEKTLENGLAIVKEFQLGTNYLFSAAVRLENRGAAPLALPAQEWVVGTATPMRADDPGTAEGLMWYNGAKSATADQSYFASSYGGCVPRTPRTEYRAGSNNVVWAAAQNQFFALAAIPDSTALEIVGRVVPLPRMPGDGGVTNSRPLPPPRGVQTAVTYSATNLAPGQVLERKFTFFAGPKEYRTLAKLGDRFQNNLDLLMGYGGFFGFFAKALLLAMNWLHHVLHFSYGWAVVGITVIIKVLFWPLTAASTRSMKKMQTLQPELNALKEKYKDDMQKFSQKQWELWKKNKVSPLSGCLPMLIQLPIFFGFFTMIRSAIELRGAGWLWVTDLSRPDTLFMMPGLNFPFNLLPLLMGVTMLWQAHLTPPSPGMDPVQQKIMRYMPLMFLVFLYNFSAGLTLYWTVQNLLTIAQMKLTKTRPVLQTAPATSPTVLAPKKKK